MQNTSITYNDVIVEYDDFAGELCHDLDVNVNGEQLVDEEGCQELPGLPA